MYDRVTEDEVIEAAVNLKEAGINPSIKGIREKLQRGSFSTISKYLKKWQDSQVRESENELSVNGVTAQELAAILSKELAQISNVYLLALPLNEATEILKLFEPEYRKKVLRRMKGQTYINESMYEKIESYLLKRISMQRQFQDNFGVTQDKIKDLFLLNSEMPTKEEH